MTVRRAFGMGWVVAALLAAPSLADEPWTPLFNGKDLSGWTPKIRGEAFGEDKDKTFRAEDGVIRVGYENYKEFGERFGHLFYKEPFSRYRLRVEYRFVGDQCPGGPGWATRNSGVMLHCQDPATMAKEQDFPVSIEAQFLGGLGKGPRPTANVCTPGTHIVLDGKLHKTHCHNSKSKTIEGDQWVTAEFEVHGSGKVRHFVDGELVLEYEQPQLDPGDANARPLLKGDNLLIDGGYISLQSESHPIEFRKVEIQPIRE